MVISQEARDWAVERDKDLQAREFLQSLNVRDEKPLGSFGFPLPDADILKRTPFGEPLRAILIGEGFCVPPIGASTHGRLWGRSNTAQGKQLWLYLWDIDALGRLMRRNCGTLQQHGWPHIGKEEMIWTSDQVPPMSIYAFVERVREVKVRPQTALFDVLADAFGDKTNAGRTDVYPGLSRREMFTAFRELRGTDDPGGPMYYDIAGINLWKEEAAAAAR